MVPNVVVWVGLRAVLGLYPGYGLGGWRVAQADARFIRYPSHYRGFAFASSVGDSLSRVLLFAWVLGLLLLAPLARYFVKRAMMRSDSGASR